MSPRTEDSASHALSQTLLEAERAGIVERIRSVVTDPMWTVSLHRNQIKLSVDTMAVLTLIHTKTNPASVHDSHYWKEQSWSVVAVNANQPVLYQHIANMMQLIASWAVTTRFELFGMAKHAAMLVEDHAHQLKELRYGSGRLELPRGETAITFPESIVITRLDNKAAQP
ncbi:MAG: hypothetical protein ACN6OP_10445 [Pseudomonadales bacterium]